MAASDPDPEALELFQRNSVVPRGYQSVEEIQDAERLDVVSICSPDEMHCLEAEQVLASNVRPRAILLEKPAAINGRELARLTELVDDSDVEVAVNHTCRFDRAHRQVARLVQSGRFGRLVGGRCTY